MQQMNESLAPEEHFVPVDGGIKLHAWVFRPVGLGAGGRAPLIMMAHGFSGLKHRGLDNYARRFAAAGFAVIVHDHRNFGLSGGVVRGDINPWQQIDDWRRVISYAEALDGVDEERIGIWGTSYAGGHAFVLGATDSRIRVVVAQVPLINGYEQSLRRVSPDARGAQQKYFSQIERAEARGEAPATQLVVSLDPAVRAAYRAPEMIAFHDAFDTPEGVEDSVYITVRSSRWAQMYEPGYWIPRIAPKPLLMVVAAGDVITPTDLALRAYESALQPKSLQLIRGGHFDAYLSEFEASCGAAQAWFARHLDGASV